MPAKMPLFWLYCVCLLLFLPTSNSVPYPSNRCSKNDCSYQIQDYETDTCKIYNTSACLDFYKFEESSVKGLTSEDESKFHVSIVPYTAELFVPIGTAVHTATRSAINITFNIFNADIDELVIKIYKKTVASEPICQIFDFHNANNTKFPINLFHDCLFNFSENNMQNVRMDFIALPVKEKLSYEVFIPGTKYTGSCSWQPLIMVFRGNLHIGVVQVKFSQAPESYNVSSYVIKLNQHPSGGEKIVDITPNISKSMLIAHFLSVNEGVYSISVKPVIWGVHNNCWTETDKVVVEIPKSYHMLTVYLCIFILLIFSTFVFLKMFRHNIAKLRFGSKRQVLLFYSHDCNEHKDFVMAFIKYLIKHCHVEVSTIYDELPIHWNPDEKPGNVIPNVNECDPQEWIKKKYNECDIIMFLISAGLFHTLDSKNSLPIQKCHEWRNQLVCATNFIILELLNSAEDIKRKKICKVCFPYSSKKYIPDALKPGFGKCYDLPQEMNNLINFMHDSREFFLCNKLCVTNFESSFAGTDLAKKMKYIQTAVDRNFHFRIIKQFSDTATNDLNFIEEAENLEKISITSDSSEENSDAFIKFISEDTHNSISKDPFVNLSSSDNICAMGNSEKFINLAINEPVEDSDSEESDLLFYHSKLQSENEAKYVIENILNEN